MNIKRITPQLLCLLIFLLSLTSVAYGTETILEGQPQLTAQNPYKEYSFDLPAGDTITIYLEVLYSDPAVDFAIVNETDTLYEKLNIVSVLEDVWTVPAEGSYVFNITAPHAHEDNSIVYILLGSELIPEFSTWTSMLLLLIVLTVAIVFYKRRLLKTPIH